MLVKYGLANYGKLIQEVKYLPLTHTDIAMILEVKYLQCRMRLKCLE